jgi:phosphoadenosine phosphosulfate reductase
MPDTLLSDEALRALNARLEPSDPSEIVRWELEESGLREIALASAFQAEGTCVMHMATQIRPEVPVLFLETGFHFEETLAFKPR